MSKPPTIHGHTTRWLDSPGPQSDVVISSRVRIARNLAAYPFLTKTTAPQRRAILNECRGAIESSDVTKGVRWVDLNAVSQPERLAMVEGHLISRQHGQGKAARGVAVSEDQTVSIMVNEEDHVRLQVLGGGLHLNETYERADAIDDAMERKLEFAFSSKLGYLTACPTNVGTGIRVSVMLHLSALKMTGEIERLRRAAKDMQLAVRGFHGEGTDAMGDLYQVSNQTSLGRSETRILGDFRDVVIPKMIEYERKAREALVRDAGSGLDDRIWRAWGTLQYAQLLGSEEALYLLSIVRMGVAVGVLGEKFATLDILNRLLIETQPAHIQLAAGGALDSAARRRFRAQYVRNSIPGMRPRKG